ncbi:GNAT family N-acetyltransferase [Sphingobacterium sp. KU25419]|nr:GNAT family N-acetyltransferase [Sphingobacterium sp. KU25419]
MEPSILQIHKLSTERLTLIPYTIPICKHILNQEFDFLKKMDLRKGRGWPDDDVLETLPKIINNLSEIGAPTGFESWMIIKNETSEIIGDIGFKGFNQKEQLIDIGYGIILGERRQGYAEEAAKALIGWAFEQGIVKEITAKCLTHNVSSIHLLQKLNFKEIKRDDIFLYWSLPYGN